MEHSLCSSYLFFIICTHSGTFPSLICPGRPTVLNYFHQTCDSPQVHYTTMKSFKNSDIWSLKIIYHFFIKHLCLTISRQRRMWTCEFWLTFARFFSQKNGCFLFFSSFFSVSWMVINLMLSIIFIFLVALLLVLVLVSDVANWGLLAVDQPLTKRCK